MQLHLPPWDRGYVGHQGSPPGNSRPGSLSFPLSHKGLSVGGQRHRVPGTTHAVFQVSKLLLPPRAIPMWPWDRCKCTNFPRSQLPEQRDRKKKKDGRPSWGDGKGCMSAQQCLIAPAAGTERLCQTGSSHRARLHTTLRTGSLGLLIQPKGLEPTGAQHPPGLHVAG